MIGRSNLFGKPMAQLLLEANATVTTCHSRTRDLPGVCAPRRRPDRRRRPRARWSRGDWVKPGAIVIDVGINRTDDGLVGDVDFDEAAEVAGAITPVPGRRRADDDRVPAAQHAAGGADAGRRSRERDARLRAGELLAGVGAMALFVSLFLDWFEPEVKPRIAETSGRRRRRPSSTSSGWTSLGWVMLVARCWP